MLPENQNSDACSPRTAGSHILPSQTTITDVEQPRLVSQSGQMEVAVNDVLGTSNSEELAKFKETTLRTTALAIRSSENDDSDFTEINASEERNYLCNYLPLSDMHVKFSIKHGTPWSAAGKERLILSRTTFFFNMFYANTRIEKEELEDSNWTMPEHIKKRFAPSPEQIDYDGHIWNHEIVGIPLHAFGHFSAMFIVGLPALRQFFKKRHTYNPEFLEARKKRLSNRYGVYRMDSLGQSQSDHWVRGYMVYVYLAAVFRDCDVHPLEIEELLPIKYLESPRQKGPSCGWHTAYYFSLFTRSPSILANRLPWELVQRLTDEAIQKHDFESYRERARNRFADLCDRYRTEVNEASEKVYTIYDEGMQI